MVERDKEQRHGRRDPPLSDLVVARGCHALGVLARESLDDAEPSASSESHISSRADLLAALDVRPRRPRRAAVSPWVALLQAVAVTLLVCLGAAGLWSLLPDRPLEYVIEGNNEGSGTYLRSTDAAMRVRFSEGSELVLEVGAAAQLAELTANGARIVAHQGRLRARIERRPDAAWTVEAGPFAVHVTGTDFSVAWDSTGKGLVVDLYDGSLLVTGPQAPEGVAIHAGQRLLGSPGTGTISLMDLPRSEGSHAPADSSGAAAAADPNATSTSEGAGASSAPGTGQGGAPASGSWRERVGAGQFEDVLAEAEAEGIDSVISSRPLEDVSALANAARYAHRPDLAAKILNAQRTRFPSSAQATTAAYLLGRLAESRGATSEAMQWYSRYRLEAPSGALAQEALGRLMFLLQQSGQDEAARTAAKQYLESYPAGASAKGARALLGEP